MTDNPIVHLGWRPWVPRGEWSFGGIESTNGREDGVLVFGKDGLEVRTELLTRQAQPISVRIHNLQLAVQQERDWTDRPPRSVIVDEADLAAVLDGRREVVRGLVTPEQASLSVEIDGLRVSVAGDRHRVDGIELVRE